ncbi:MAG: hypothetical protein AAF488_13020 [Planctomycetota bacterium]
MIARSLRNRGRWTSWAAACLIASACIGCANSSSSGSNAGGSNDVEPKSPEKLSEVAVPSSFTFETTETVDIEVVTAGRHDGFIVIVLEPGTPDYDPHRALKKAKGEAGSSFSGSVRIEAGASSVPVVLFENGALEFHEVTIIDRRAELSR